MQPPKYVLRYPVRKQSEITMNMDVVFSTSGMLKCPITADGVFAMNAMITATNHIKVNCDVYVQIGNRKGEPLLLVASREN